jgi:hypothetical protein
MDLRGFTPQNRGVTHEINVLVDDVPLGQVVFVTDDTTDEWFLRQTVQEAWNRMRADSPNRSSAPGQLHLFRFTGGAATSGACCTPCAPVQEQSPQQRPESRSWILPFRRLSSPRRPPLARVLLA